MDGVGRIVNKQKVTEKDTGDIEQWRVLIITGIIIIIILCSGSLSPRHGASSGCG